MAIGPVIVKLCSECAELGHSLTHVLMRFFG